MSEIIYRIQDSNGRGPFKPGFSHVWVEKREDHIKLTPWFDEFGPVQNNLLIGEHAGCGCTSIEQLRRWFTKREYKRLKKHGYQAVKLKAGRILAESKIQCVFGRAYPLAEGSQKISLY